MKAQHLTIDPEVSSQFLFSPSSEFYVCFVYNVQRIQLYLMERVPRWSRIMSTLSILLDVLFNEISRICCFEYTC